MRDTERGRDTGRGRSRLPAGELMWDSIPGPQGHTLSRRQMLNHGATQALPDPTDLKQSDNGHCSVCMRN